MIAYGGVADVASSPGSPPGMTASKSSKSSSFQSSLGGSGDDSVLADASHFEDIGLDDESTFVPQALQADSFKSTPNPYSPSFSSDLRAASLTHASTPRLQYSRDLASKPRPKATRPPFPSLQNHVRSATGRAPGPALMPPRASSATRRRSPSPNLSLHPRDPNLPIRPRRSSWQSAGGGLRERKSALDLELECDEDDGDDIPEGLILDNVPLSPRPVQERARSQPCSTSPSPERTPRERERVRSVGNGTPPVAAAQGSLRSPMWKSDTSVPSLQSATSSTASSPVKPRAKSWTLALAALTPEAKQLTEKLEEHADEVDHVRLQRSSTASLPARRRRSVDHDVKPRVRSALAELPPLCRTNIMIDPLPISKEKEAVLSRTRPSWLPPKDPAEERRHLREYQKMMALSAEADRKREAARRVRSECRDTTVESQMHRWEDVLSRWDEAVRERRTRELWWRGVPPRSRGEVWTRAIGNELGLSETSYDVALRRAHDTVSHGRDDARVALSDTIRRDVEERTWPELRIFQTDGPLHQSLLDVLMAYAVYRSDIGYVRGLNTIAALLLLNLSTPAAAFIALANMLNRALPLSFLANDPGAKASAYNLLLQTLAHKSPNLHDHLVGLPNHDADPYLSGPLSSLFTIPLTVDETARLWDVFVFEGDTVLVRAGVALLMRKEMALLGCTTVAQVAAIVDSAAKPFGGDGEDRWVALLREAGRA